MLLFTGLFSCHLYAQDVNKSIDSILKKYKKSYSKEALYNYHKTLNKSIENSYVKGEYKSYMAIIWYHGYLSRDTYRLDSTMHYFNLVETKLNKLNLIKYKELIGEYYTTKGIVLNESFELINESLKAFSKASDYIDKSNINSMAWYDLSLSRVYMQKDNFDKTLKILNNRIKDSANINDNYKMLILHDLAHCYRLSNQPYKSLEVNTKIIEYAKDKINKDDFWWAKNEICNNYYDLGLSRKAIDSALAIRTNLENDKNSLVFKNNTDYLSRFYHDIDINKSISYLESIVSSKEKNYSSNVVLSNRYATLASYYDENKSYEKAAELYKKSNRLLDSIRSSDKSLFARYTTINDKFIEEKQLNIKIKNANDILIKKNNRQKLYVLFLSVLVLILILIFLVFSFYKKYKKGEEEIEVLKINEKKLLEEQIILRDNELEAKAVAFSQRVLMLNKIKKDLRAKDLTDAEKVKNTSKTISKLINSATDISSISDKMSSKYPSLAIILRKSYPDLTDREIDYCLLSRLNLSIKETASLLNVSSGTVKVARSRLKVKMKIPAEISLQKHLESISETINETK